MTAWASLKAGPNSTAGFADHPGTLWKHVFFLIIRPVPGLICLCVACFLLSITIAWRRWCHLTHFAMALMEKYAYFVVGVDGSLSIGLNAWQLTNSRTYHHVSSFADSVFVVSCCILCYPMSHNHGWFKPPVRFWNLVGHYLRFGHIM